MFYFFVKNEINNDDHIQ